MCVCVCVCVWVRKNLVLSTRQRKTETARERQREGKREVLTWCVNSVSLRGRLLHVNILCPPFVHGPLTRTGEGVLAAANTGTARTWQQTHNTTPIKCYSSSDGDKSYITVKSNVQWTNSPPGYNIKFWSILEFILNHVSNYATAYIRGGIEWKSPKRKVNPILLVFGGMPARKILKSRCKSVQSGAFWSSNFT